MPIDAARRAEVDAVRRLRSGAPEAAPEVEEPAADGGHWTRQNRHAGTGQFQAGFRKEAKPDRALPGKFGGSAPAPAADDATWLTRRQAARRGHGDQGWGSSKNFDAVHQGLKNGDDPSELFRRYGGADPVPGRSAADYIKEDGRPVLYHKDLDWAGGGNLSEQAVRNFDASQGAQRPISIAGTSAFSGDPRLIAALDGDMPLVNMFKRPGHEYGNSDFWDKHAINIEAPSREAAGRTAAHEIGHWALSAAEKEEGRHPFSVPGDPIRSGVYQGGYPDAQNQNGFAAVYYDQLRGRQPFGSETWHEANSAQQEAARYAAYAKAPEEWRVSQSERMANMSRSHLQGNMFKLGEFDPHRNVYGRDAGTQLSPDEAAWVRREIDKNPAVNPQSLLMNLWRQSLK